MKNVHDEIEKELITFKGQTFNSSEDVNKWIHDAMFRIAEKTVEAVRVEEKKELTKFERSYMHPLDIGNIEGYNKAVTEQTNLASKWLGKE